MKAMLHLILRPVSFLLRVFRSAIRNPQSAMVVLLPASFLLLASPLLAADAGAAPTWHAQTLGQALGYMLLFAVIGIGAAIAGYKLFDKCTPGDLNKEIIENKNVAAAIVAAAVILGVSIIIGAAMLG